MNKKNDEGNSVTHYGTLLKKLCSNLDLDAYLASLSLLHELER